MTTHMKGNHMNRNTANATQLQDEIMRQTADLREIHAPEMLAGHRELMELGAALHWLHPVSKRPIGDNWSEKPRADFERLARTYQPGNNVGIRLGEPSLTPAGNFMVLDLDIRDESKADVARAKLLELCPNAFDLPTVQSGSGGSSRHFYFVAPSPLRSRKLAKSEGFTMVWSEEKQREVKKHDWEIDLLGTGKQVVLPPSVHPDTKLPYRWLKPLDTFYLGMEGMGPEIDLERIKEPERTLPAAPSQPVDMATLESALAAIDPTILDYDEWLRIGMGIFDAKGGSEAGLMLWDALSQRDPGRYEGLSDLRGRWRGFGKPFVGDPITAGTVFGIAKVHGWKRPPRPSIIEGWNLDREWTELPDLPATVQPQPKLMVQKNGELRATLHNAIVTLEAVDRKKGLGIRRNEMTLRDQWRAGVIGDADLALIRVHIERAGMHCVGSELTAQAVRAVAERNPYHPARAYLASLTHDGTPRLDTWLTQYLQVQDSPYVRAAGRAFLIAMIARVMKPGCKHDHVLVLRGKQGLRKSTACSILGGTWYGDNMPSIRDGGREAGLYLRGHWLIEMAELAPSRKAEQEDLKAFLTRASDEIRAPYARMADVVPRQCVFIGTSNEDAILKDATGGRRFWPVTVERQIDTDALARDRDQLFAEALAAFNAGEAWHLTPEAEAQAAEVQEAAREEDPWEQIIRDWLDSEEYGGGQRDAVTMREVLWQALDIPIPQQTVPAQRRAASILRMMGWSKERGSRGNKVWKRG